MNIRGQQIYAKKSGMFGWEIRLRSYQKVRLAEIVEKTKILGSPNRIRQKICSVGHNQDTQRKIWDPKIGLKKYPWSATTHKW